MEKSKEKLKSHSNYIEPNKTLPNRIEIEDESKTFALWRKYSKRAKKK